VATGRSRRRETEGAATWVDPRDDPRAPHRGPERPLAHSEDEVAELVLLSRQGRLYVVEAWIASGKPLQLDPAKRPRRGRPTTPLREELSAGSFDLARLLLCNGYRTALEPYAPLDDALAARRWDLLDLLLDWGADPDGADVAQDPQGGGDEPELLTNLRRC